MKKVPSMDCCGTIDTWVYKALNVLHHQLTGQANGVLEISRSHVPVRMVFMATPEPKGHHREEKVNHCIDPKPGSWKRKVSLRTGIAELSCSEREAPVVAWHRPSLSQASPTLWEAARKKNLLLIGEYVVFGGIFLVFDDFTYASDTWINS